MNYRHDIDGLRAIAVILVIFFHADIPLFERGYVGVDIFFVISGFLITSLIIKDLETGRFTITDFYERRARRIFPALSFVIICCIPFAYAWMLPERLHEFGESVIATSLFASNFYYITSLNYFSPDAGSNPLLHTWSLAVEEQYYLFFPVLMMIIWRFGRRVSFSLLLIMFGISLLGSEYLSRVSPAANFYFSPSRAWELLAGSLCAFMITSNYKLPKSPALGVAGLIMILAWAFLPLGRSNSPSFATIWPILGTVAIILFSRPGDWFYRALGNRVLVGIGLISYSAYLWHQPVFAFARLRSMTIPSIWEMLFLSALTFGLAALTWRWVEKPFRGTAGKKMFSRRSIFSGVIVATIGFVVAGAFILSDQMVPSRFQKLDVLNQEIARLQDRRSEHVRDGSCSIYPVTSWRETWACDPFSAVDRDDQLIPVGIAIIGDSHASDKAAALRYNGYDPMQATTAGCSVTYRFARKPCQEFFINARETIKANQNISELWLSSRFWYGELKEEVFRETLEFWLESEKRVVLFSSMPEFPELLEKLKKAAMFEDEVILERNTKMAEQTTADSIRSIAAEYGVTIIDTSALFCSMTGDCGPINNQGEMLYMDEDHFSDIGAKAFGDLALRDLACTQKTWSTPPTGLEAFSC